MSNNNKKRALLSIKMLELEKINKNKYIYEIIIVIHGVLNRQYSLLLCM